MIDDLGLLAARVTVGLSYAAHGTQKAPWIAKGVTYVFRLYVANRPRASVVVLRKGSAPAVTARPGLVRVRGKAGRASVSWSTGVNGYPGMVYVSENGSARKLFAGGAHGTKVAPWIRHRSTYVFALYVAKNPSPAASVVVRGR